jgi:hypothetical protein
MFFSYALHAARYVTLAIESHFRDIWVSPSINRGFTKAHFPLGEFVRTKRKTNPPGNVIGQRKKFAAKKLNQFLLFYCSREQIRLVWKMGLIN